MRADDITIAVTVFDRRDFIEQAVASALAQTQPVRVTVVEDCGPDAGLQPMVLSRFGSRISYHRNPQRRGLFDNWNACIERCTTPWLCLLHDDDFLAPDFVEAMVDLAAKIPDQGLYHGRCHIVDPAGKVAGTTPALPGAECQPTDPLEAALRNRVRFPAELFRADYVAALGGFHRSSLFTGDWDMWAKLALHHGAAWTNRVVGNSRTHDIARGTMRVVRTGKIAGLAFMQAKKNAAMLRQHGTKVRFDRAAILHSDPLATRFLLENARGFSRRMLLYNYALLWQSPSPRVGHLLFRLLAGLFGPQFLSGASKLHQVWADKKRGRESGS